MAKLFFKYGAMDSSKTANLLMTVHNYESQEADVLIFKPIDDTRSSRGMVESRVGLSHSCIDILKTDNLKNIYIKESKKNINIQAILIDESQFLTKQQVKQLCNIVDDFNIPVICFGLKNSYIDGELFEGSAALLYYAEKLEEIKNVCYCGKKATMNLRILNGKPIYNGDIVNCGDTKTGDDYYTSVCRKHYYNPFK